MIRIINNGEFCVCISQIIFMAYQIRKIFLTQEVNGLLILLALNVTLFTIMVTMKIGYSYYLYSWTLINLMTSSLTVVFVESIMWMQPQQLEVITILISIQVFNFYDRWRELVAKQNKTFIKRNFFVKVVRYVYAFIRIGFIHGSIQQISLFMIALLLVCLYGQSLITIQSNIQEKYYQDQLSQAKETNSENLFGKQSIRQNYEIGFKQIVKIESLQIEEEEPETLRVRRHSENNLIQINQNIFNIIVDQFPDGVAIIQFSSDAVEMVEYCNESIKFLLEIDSGDDLVRKIKSIKKLKNLKQKRIRSPTVNCNNIRGNFYTKNLKNQDINQSQIGNNGQNSDKKKSSCETLSPKFLPRNAFDIELSIIKKQIQRPEIHAYYKRSQKMFHLQSIFNGQSETKQGQKICLEIKLYVGYFNSSVKLLLSASDVSYRDLIKNLEEQNEAKSNQLSYVSHEFRTPLNSMISMLEFCEEDEIANIPDTKTSRSSIQIKQKLQYLKIAQLNCQYLVSLSNDLLDLAQIKIGRFELNKQTFDLKNLLTECLSMFCLLAGGKQINQIIEYSSKTPILVFQDRNRIKQIMINLLGNAYKFTLEGAIEIIADYDELEQNIILTVKDSGMGIRQEDQSILFKAFGKGDNIENKKYNKQGVGLGLLISNMIAKCLNNLELNNGLIFRSQYGQGTQVTFSICIDQRQSDNSCSDSIILEGNTSRQEYKQKVQLRRSLNSDKSQSQQLISRRQQSDIDIYPSGMQSAVNLCDIPPDDGTPQKLNKSNSFYQQKQINNFKCECSNILIVDDNQFNIDALAMKLLKRKIHRVEQTISGKLAVQKVKDKQNSRCCRYFKIIFLDLEMPYMNGYETFAQMKLISDDSSMPLVVVACSGYTEDSEKTKCALIGMEEYLEKPLNNACLGKILDKYL